MGSNSQITNSVTSKDGTTIGYRQLGQGPGIVLVHGAMQSSQNLIKLGRILSDPFTVYIPDRRGRGLSDPHASSHNIQKECEDLDALLNKTNTHNVFGLSAGAAISLQAALMLPEIHKVAVYEPPLFTEESDPIDWGTRYEKELAQGDLAEAFVTIGKGTGVFPRIFRILPRFLLVPLMNRALKNENEDENDVSLTDLIPTVQYDLQMVRSAHLTPSDFEELSTEILLLGGDKSPERLRKCLDELEAVLPEATRIEFTGLDHLGPDNDGKPKQVAQELHQFFS
ncbi:alpha/beta fold hydrolase [Halosolutus gelatinilyticus]|uniref:alpha/beta fold hydrolase n=1 Tax=Halosolutus gelatinilyticus TaxID=2931975 RepID=UPI001FF50948|nr:alpha/beta hydrolase [Halosolutus gelatinilyticus]